MRERAMMRFSIMLISACFQPTATVKTTAPSRMSWTNALTKLRPNSACEFNIGDAKIYQIDHRTCIDPKCKAIDVRSKESCADLCRRTAGCKYVRFDETTVRPENQACSSCCYLLKSRTASDLSAGAHHFEQQVIKRTPARPPVPIHPRPTYPPSAGAWHFLNCRS